ncbi:spermidine/putrescine ABC transporter ATP-binding protein [Pantoea ananatis]|jgi:iron(III) transport system ATP-binding protein|uniref:Vitamin B12 import ATP-binding protein BtuD n=1 Tax=Pantoea ananas TaxID=553 RepID=A0AAJ1D1F6_PANAN|nr:ABC transporter ATP-binding protein [Pantoea ananatis]KGL54841.1 spermidine/putrescine ABC transporter ATP-binding protein [Pantoea ananatis]KTR49062.1 spermidine/putrescine ABC transporter ATP-binding protein [Pantoea ananatis]KTR55443.1 spermidine/putrescine ABC transporter ATP-binding protein [Pantoea ananatis]KTR64618.1 spermidine/putrescine ABC transporter ATP-binding protein [Pantoea ananatis]KTR72237.1 spermidine/putrescine ABC transporter ATP-binding protein [Pantoea ananatis]
MAAISLSGLDKAFAAQPVLEAVSLEIQQGEFIAVLGPSGCGKTTLLRLIAGFETLDRGEIWVDDTLFASPNFHLPPENRDLGVVFQNYALWPHMTVAENVGYSLKVSGVNRADREERIRQALALVGLLDFADRRPADLSGGQRQRVALARCLVAKPRLVLLDEPLANLDVHLRAAMEEEFRRFHRHSGATLIYITHDQREAMALADRVVVLNAGQVMQFASPQTLWREPANEMVATFIDEGRVLPVKEIEPTGQGLASVRLFGTRMRLRCAAHQTALPQGKASFHRASFRLTADESGHFTARVERLIYRGGHYDIHLSPQADPEVSITLALDDVSALRVNDTVNIAVTDGWILPA